MKSKLIFEEFIFKLNQANMFSEDEIEFLCGLHKVDIYYRANVDEMVDICIRVKNVALASS